MGVSNSKATRSAGVTVSPSRLISCVVLCAAALFGAGAAHAERITPDDLLNGVLPSATMTFEAITLTGIQSGSYNTLTSETDANSVQFDMSKLDTEGCGADFQLSGISASQYFNTYAIRVAKSSQHYTVERAPKKWQIWGKTSEEGAEWVLIST